MDKRNKNRPCSPSVPCDSSRQTARPGLLKAFIFLFFLRALVHRSGIYSGGNGKKKFSNTLHLTHSQTLVCIKMFRDSRSVTVLYTQNVPLCDPIKGTFLLLLHRQQSSIRLYFESPVFIWMDQVDQVHKQTGVVGDWT